MSDHRNRFSRRNFLVGSALAGISLSRRRTFAWNNPKAQIAITLDLEMARNYPTWDQTHWDYEKGNLDDATKQYALHAARRVKQKGGLIHFFVVGRVFEQEAVDWLQEIVQSGHPVGNHTYDHVNIRAKELSQIQPRFRRCPWLIEDKATQEVIAQNIRMTTAALKTRIGIDPAGFRAPGGFPNGLGEYLHVQEMLLSLGFPWVSTKYVAHPVGVPGYVPTYTQERRNEPPQDVYQAILSAQEDSQPFVYPSGLIEIPMCPISDLIAFRTGRWKREHFLKAIRDIVNFTIERNAAWVFLGHPSCLSVVDPQFATMDLICDLVRQAGDKAEIVDLNTIARRL